ncbi:MULTISPECIES: DUF3617 domain-containing protein [unclassified Duganella]|uniref:DUF3617 domain-containing protein n=1 Tax=unclassified Duganella TaxID=2636909 RepID=UPI000891B431|nr:MULTISPECIES: DUF3617 domain-containing protein [unclassified Duganella]SDH55815.1 Protein of unknown function [Duganella sp. OV458]SDK67453.1 Protein of unknown function [Duganella sp. OV510]
MKRLLISMAMLAAAHASAQTQTIKPGLWELTNKIKTGDRQTDQALSSALAQLAVLPPEQRARVEAMMAQNGVSMPQAGGDGSLKMTACVTPEMAARKELPLNQQGKCTSKQDPVPGGLNVSFTCTDPASSGQGQIRLQGDSAYTMTMNVTNNSGTGPQNATVESTGRWLGASCPATPK